MPMFSGKPAASIGFGALIAIVISLCSLHSYIFFHTVAEFFSVTIAISIFLFSVSTSSEVKNHYFRFLGIAYLFIGILDLAHALSYKGMMVLPSYGSDAPTQLWISARYIESVSLLLSFLFFSRKVNYWFTFCLYFLVSSIVLLSVFYFRSFPEAFSPETGLTTFKIVSEYIIVLILLVVLALIKFKKESFDVNTSAPMMWAILATIFAELSFTFYIDVYGLSNFFGHFLKIISFYLIFVAIVQTSLRNPLRTIFAKLTRAQSELEDRNRALSNFCSVVAHDLRSPLVTIQGFLEIISGELNLEKEKKLKKHIEILNKNTTLLSDRVNGLLLLARCGEGSKLNHTFSVDELVKATTEMLFDKIKERESKIVVNGGETCIKAEKTELLTIFQNIIENSLKYSNMSKQHEIEITAYKKQKNTIVVFRDNGIGFSSRFQQELFSPFAQVDGKSSGLGLGLSFVKKIMESYKGSVSAHSDGFEKGAVFTLKFPD